MKARRALVAACVLGALAAPSVTRAAGWRLVFEDQFDGTQLDRGRWATRYVYEGGTLGKLNDEWQRYADRDNHQVARGVLSLVARPTKATADGGRFESGMIRSRQTFYYGYFEARVRLPGARGVWPAFWLNSDFDGDGRLGWPPEIDIFEYVINGTHETPDMIHASVVVGKTGRQGGDWLWRHQNFNEKWSYLRAPAPLDQDWHVVGLLWKPDSVSVYLDGEKLFTRSYRWVYDDGAFAGPAHVLLNLAVGGGWAGRNGVDETAFPQALMIDYVRVCQFSAGAGGDRLCNGSRFTPAADESAYRAPADDLSRSKLLSAALSAPAASAGARLTAKYSFEAVNGGVEHQVRTTLIDAAGREALVLGVPPATPTTRWRGRQTVVQTLDLPAELAPGTYRVLVGIGSRGARGTEARAVPLTAATGLGEPDGWQRYKVADLVVTPRPAVR